MLGDDGHQAASACAAPSDATQFTALHHLLAAHPGVLVCGGSGWLCLPTPDWAREGDRAQTQSSQFSLALPKQRPFCFAFLPGVVPCPLEVSLVPWQGPSCTSQPQQKPLQLLVHLTLSFSWTVTISPIPSKPPRSRCASLFLVPLHPVATLGAQWWHTAILALSLPDLLTTKPQPKSSFPFVCTFLAWLFPAGGQMLLSSFSGALFLPPLHPSSSSGDVSAQHCKTYTQEGFLLQANK